MVDDRDLGTVPMPLEVKRGRGRPRKPDALTPAERARRYRARRVAALAAATAEIDALRIRDVTENCRRLPDINPAMATLLRKALVRPGRVPAWASELQSTLATLGISVL